MSVDTEQVQGTHRIAAHLPMCTLKQQQSHEKDQTTNKTINQQKSL